MSRIPVTTLETLDLRIGAIEMTIAERNELIERERRRLNQLIDMHMDQHNAKLLVTCAHNVEQYANEIAALTEQLRGFQQIRNMLKEEQENG